MIGNVLLPTLALLLASVVMERLAFVVLLRRGMGIAGPTASMPSCRSGTYLRRRLSWPDAFLSSAPVGGWLYMDKPLGVGCDDLAAEIRERSEEKA
jgi:hypothetical protein